MWKRTSFVKAENMDFKSGLDEVLAASCVSTRSMSVYSFKVNGVYSYDEPPPRNILEYIWGWLVGSDTPIS